jgi:hypothetical protein
VSVRLAMIAEPTTPSKRSWVMGALVKPEASIVVSIVWARLADRSSVNNGVSLRVYSLT